MNRKSLLIIIIGLLLSSCSASDAKNSKTEESGQEITFTEFVDGYFSRAEELNEEPAANIFPKNAIANYSISPAAQYKPTIEYDPGLDTYITKYTSDGELKVEIEYSWTRNYYDYRIIQATYKNEPADQEDPYLSGMPRSFAPYNRWMSYSYVQFLGKDFGLYSLEETSNSAYYWQENNTGRDYCYSRNTKLNIQRENDKYFFVDENNIKRSVMKIFISEDPSLKEYVKYYRLTNGYKIDLNGKSDFEGKQLSFSMQCIFDRNGFLKEYNTSSTFDGDKRGQSLVYRF